MSPKPARRLDNARIYRRHLEKKEAEKEMQELEAINPDKIKYELLLLEEKESVFGKVKPVIDWIFKGKYTHLTRVYNSR